MKSLKIKYEPKLDDAEISAAAGFFRLNGVFEYVDMLNWPIQFPYKPSCQFKIARSQRSLFIHFKVIESNIRALYVKDQDLVSEDSCVAFFFKNPEENNYFNFEFNCIGTCSATQCESKTLNASPLSTASLNLIKRFATLGDVPFDEKIGNFEWKLTVEIPFSIIELPVTNLPKVLMANFYKCADGTSVPHYLSWSHILTPQPDFHQPKDFGVVNF